MLELLPKVGMVTGIKGDSGGGSADLTSCNARSISASVIPWKQLRTNASLVGCFSADYLSNFQATQLGSRNLQDLNHLLELPNLLVLL